MRKNKMKLNNDELKDCFVSRARLENIEGKYQYEDIIRIPYRDEAISLKDAKKIISFVRKNDRIPNLNIRTYSHIGGGVYNIHYQREISETSDKVFFGCQSINREVIKKLKLK